VWSLRQDGRLPRLGALRHGDERCEAVSGNAASGVANTAAVATEAV